MARAAAPPSAPTARIVAVGGRRVRVRVAGEGDPLVLVHGLSGSWRWWRPVLAALGARHAVHVVDLPRFRRHGLRPEAAAEWLEELLVALALRPAHVAAHSLGGLVAVQLAARSPESVRRLVLVAPAGVPPGRSLLGHALPLAAALRTASPSLLTSLVLDAARTRPTSLLRGARFAISEDVRARLADVQAPTLLVWGERDPLVLARHAGEWLVRLPDARLVLVPRAGHVPMFDAPDELAAAVLGFLEEGADEARNTRGR